MSATLRRCCALGLLALLGACGAQISVGTKSALPAREIAIRAARAQPSAQPALLIATRDGELFAYDLAGGERGAGALRFRVAIEKNAHAELLGDVIWIHTASSIRALDTAQGAELYRIALSPSGAKPARYMGAARAGKRIAYGSVSGTELDPSARSTIHAVDARTGKSVFKREITGYAAAPVAVSAETSDSRWGLLLVPLQRQWIVVLDAHDGAPLARLRAQSDAIDWVHATEGAVLFGGRRMHRLTATRTVGEPQPAAVLTLPSVLRELPGRPEAPRSAYATPGTAASLRRVALHIAPTPSVSDPQAIALLADRAYFTFYGHVLGFDGRGQLVLARRLDADVLDARVVDRGLLVVTASGEVQLLSHATGATLAAAAFGIAIASAQLPAWTHLPAALLAAPASTVKPSDPQQALTHGLLAIARDVDTRLVPSRVLATRALARLPEPSQTRDLLELYERPSTPPELQRALADGISIRRQGLAHLVDALHRRYGFLEQTRPAPLTVIAPVLAAAGEKSALPLLLERLRDHETPVTALPSLARAIGALGDDAAAAQLIAWLRLYRNDSSLHEAPDALREVARAVIALRHEDGRQALRAMLADGGADSSATNAITPLLAPPTTSVTPSTPAASAPLQRAVALPRTLSQREVNAAFAKLSSALRPCLDRELQRNPKLEQVRIAFVAEGDGSAHAFHVAPESSELVDCLYPTIASLRLPQFARDRAVAQVVIDAQPERETAPKIESAERAREPWWAWRIRAPHPNAQTHAPRAPWWLSRQVFGSRIESGPPAITPAAPAASAPATPAPATAPAPATPAPAPATPAPTTTPAPSTPEPETERWWLPESSGASESP